MGRVSALFALTLAFSAALLFAVQPLAARASLPVLGGSPAVWNTTMVFFQAVVLAGYAAAHALARRTTPRFQAATFIAAIVAAAVVLPPIAPEPNTSPAHPLGWLLRQLTAQLALPCFALALASPLLQRWYARVTGDTAEPYRLYAASNAGSLGALLGYPVLLEPFLELDQQARLWSFGFAAWGLAIAFLARLSMNVPKVARLALPGGLSPLAAREGLPPPGSGSQDVSRFWSASPPTDQAPEPHTLSSKPSTRTLWAWIALAAVPASLLQGCTLFLTTDVASVPLLWVIPLALYLASFIVAFAQKGSRWVSAAHRALPFLASALLYVILSRATQPVGLLVALHLAFLFLAGTACHGRLVSLRPHSEHLTQFYLALAVGGVLGGSFNALAAPHLFRTVAEYPMGIALACGAVYSRVALRNQIATTTHPITEWLRDLAWAVSVAVGMAVLGLTAPWWTEGSSRVRDAVVFGIPAIACCALLDRPRRLSLATAGAFITGLWLQGLWSHTGYSERNFFGVTRVTRDPVAGSHQIVHGNTIHGRQFQDPARRLEPLTYYHRFGPLGSVFEAFRERTENPTLPPSIGVIGLGAGSMAAYARPSEHWTFFEIDPAVIRVAQNPDWFSFLRDSQAGRIDILEGDARLRLRQQTDAAFDLLVLDAFSSDAIPVHLLTREALQIYLSKIRPGGWLVTHISNRYLNLEPVLAALALDAGMVCRSFDDTHEDPALGKEPSHWILMARAEQDLGVLAKRVTWVPAAGGKDRKPWTDRRAGILEAIEWK